MRKIEEIATTVVDTAFHLHRDLGPGLLETVYEAVLEKMLSNQGLVVERKKPVPIEFAGITFEEGFRADLVVENSLVVEPQRCKSWRATGR